MNLNLEIIFNTDHIQSSISQLDTGADRNGSANGNLITH